MPAGRRPPLTKRCSRSSTPPAVVEVLAEEWLPEVVAGEADPELHAAAVTSTAPSTAATAHRARRGVLRLGPRPCLHLDVLVHRHRPHRRCRVDPLRLPALLRLGGRIRSSALSGAPLPEREIVRLYARRDAQGEQGLLVGTRADQLVQAWLTGDRDRPDVPTVHRHPDGARTAEHQIDVLGLELQQKLRTLPGGRGLAPDRPVTGVGVRVLRDETRAAGRRSSGPPPPSGRPRIGPAGSRGRTRASSVRPASDRGRPSDEGAPLSGLLPGGVAG